VVPSGIVSNEILAELRAGTLFIRQVPGPKNALGAIMFDFPNESSVYMHDTPTRQLFSRSRRDFSHGCIRLENPFDLAVWVLKDRPEWSQDRMVEAMNGAAPTKVGLAEPIPVLIVYGTAVVPENGRPHFYEDIYGLDALLERQLTQHSRASANRE
jgi:murein L,D-transpeptidase YcbB/YkuD